jgi:hypothetical protein
MNTGYGVGIITLNLAIIDSEWLAILISSK